MSKGATAGENNEPEQKPTTNRVCKYSQQQEKFADMATRDLKKEDRKNWSLGMESAN